MKTFMHPEDLPPAETAALLESAVALKKDPIRSDLAGKVLAAIFFNASLRTRISFDVAMRHLGGHTTFLNVGEGTWNLEYRDGVVMDGAEAEHIREAGAVMARYADALAIRAFPKYDSSWQENRKELIHQGFRDTSDLPLINMESSLHHPCQGLADMMTIREQTGDPKGQPILITWGWHVGQLPMAVTNSILVEAAKAGMDIRLAHPKGWELDDDVMSSAQSLAQSQGGGVQVLHDFDEGLSGARFVYCKSWGSIRNYGNREKEKQEALAHQSAWQLTADRMAETGGGQFMHCLPVRRGVEVTADVLDSPASIVVDQAENRLHAQKALLLKMLAS